MVFAEDLIKRGRGSIRKFGRMATRMSRAWKNSHTESRAKNLGARVELAGLTVDDGEGCAAFNSHDLGFGRQVDHIARLARSWTNERGPAGSSKPFLWRLLRPEDFFEHREFMDVALHPSLFGAITKYLGQVPWLVSMTVWLSPPNNTAIRSQLYHFDHRDMRQAKVFINLNTITDESGPLHFLPASASLKVERKCGYRGGRYQDDEVYSAVAPSAAIAVTGAPGQGYIVDTARCLHYGSRGNQLPRLVFMVNFARANCVNEGDGDSELDQVRERLVEKFYKNDPARSFSVQARA